MNKPPAFQFYPSDFLSDINVATMTMEERGVYITLLSHHWIEDGLPNNEEELKALCQNPNNWGQIWGKVGKCFNGKNGKLYNKRLLKEKQKQKEWRKKSQQGGINSGISRGRKAEPPLNHPSTKNEPPLNSSSSSSTSSFKDNIYSTQFEEFWNNYPRKKGKKIAYAKWKNLTKIQRDEAIIGSKHYGQEMKDKNKEEDFIKLPATFLNKKAEHWKDHQEPDASGLTSEEYNEKCDEATLEERRY